MNANSANTFILVSDNRNTPRGVIICRVRDDHGAVPLLAAYDYQERVFTPPLPILFQRHVGTENRAISAPAIRSLLDAALAATGRDILLPPSR